MIDQRAVSWIGSLVDGHLCIGDWTAWRWGRLERRELPDLASCFTAIEQGVCISSTAAASALALALSSSLFRLTDDWSAEAPGDELDSALLQLLDRCAPLLQDPLMCWAVNRLRDISDAHLYMLSARELAARLFMEARRLRHELACREERLVCELARQTQASSCRLLASDNVCYGSGDGMLSTALAQTGLQIDPGPYGDLLRALAVADGRRDRGAASGILAVAGHAVDDEARVHLDPGCAQTIEDQLAAGGACWLLLPRYANGQPGRHGRDRYSLPAGHFSRMITETWTSDDPALDADALGVEGGDTPSLMQ